MKYERKGGCGEALINGYCRCVIIFICNANSQMIDFIFFLAKQNKKLIIIH